MSKKNKKLKILFHSNHSKAYTGFGKNCKNILKYLFSTGKYEIVEMANGFSKDVPSLKKLPWDCIGSMPNDPDKLKAIRQDPGLNRAAHYGSEMIDSIIKEVQPDIYIGAEDIWGFKDFWKKKWWDKINSVIWTTLDSEPMLPMAVDAAPYIKNYYVWASFAEREMGKLGHEHVKTLHGAIDTENFYRLDNDSRDSLRDRFKISKNDFIVGFVFRNQLRKSVPNLLEGFKIFKSEHPDSNAKLLLHTSWDEGWDILRLIKEKQLNISDILTTYHCPSCKNYHVVQFFGKNQDCPYCKSKESFNTVNVKNGINENQLNEIYNLMDVYCHPFTSGGQEIPIQEAKLSELVTLVTNYSCGEDCCSESSGGLPLTWAEYREPGTQFIKASTHPHSISEQLSNAFKMPQREREAMGKTARQFVLDHYSIDVIGPKIESILDNMPKIKWDFDFSEEKRDPDYLPTEISDDKLWLQDIYSNILKFNALDDDEGLSYWLDRIKKGTSRSQILDHFRKVAQKENSEIEKKSIEDFLDDEGPEYRILIVVKEAEEDVFLINSFLENLKNLYPDCNIYIATDPKYCSLIEDNEYCHRVIPYDNKMNDSLLMEGFSSHEGYFRVALYPTLSTQMFPNYFHNGVDKNVFNII